MNLRETSTGSLRTALCGDQVLSVVVAPNFEQRSIGVIEWLLSNRAQLMEEGATLRPLNWLVLTFQGRNSPGFLDGVKGNHARKAMEMLVAEGFNETARHRSLPYPIDEDLLVSEIRAQLGGLGEAHEVLIDFSAIPRNVLFRLMRALSQGRLEPHIARGAELTLAYCWAKGYPEVGNLELIGEIRGQFERRALSEFVSDSDYCELVVLAAGSVHDAYSALASVEQLSRSAQVAVTVIYLVRDENLRESWRQLRNHHGLLHDTTTGWEIDFAFNITHVLDIMQQRMERAAREARQGRTVRVAAAVFGPKPAAVGTQMLVESFRGMGEAEHLSFSLDIFNSMGSQYLSVYSLGVGDLSVYALDG